MNVQKFSTLRVNYPGNNYYTERLMARTERVLRKTIIQYEVFAPEMGSKVLVLEILVLMSTF